METVARTEGVDHGMLAVLLIEESSGPDVAVSTHGFEDEHFVGDAGSRERFELDVAGYAGFGVAVCDPGTDSDVCE